MTYKSTDPEKLPGRLVPAVQILVQEMLQAAPLTEALRGAGKLADSAAGREQAPVGEGFQIHSYSPNEIEHGFASVIVVTMQHRAHLLDREPAQLLWRPRQRRTVFLWFSNGLHVAVRCEQA